MPRSRKDRSGPEGLKSGEIADFKEQTGIRSPVDPMLSSVSKKALGRLLALDRIDRLYYEIVMKGESRPFLESLLAELNISIKVNEDDLLRVPREGPLVVTANHPYGGLDGLVLMSVLSMVRPDVKVMANYILGRIGELSHMFILVDPFERKESAAGNMRPLKEALGWLKEGGVLGMFPAGEVSHIDWNKWQVTDPKWADMAARLVLKTGAAVLPAYFTGQNSTLFQLSGLIHPRLRTVMLPRELLKMSNQTLEVRFGSPISIEKSRKFERHQDLVKYYRWRTYVLAGTQAENREAEERAASEPVRPSAVHNSTEALVREINSLPAKNLLVESDVFAVYRAKADQIPNLLQEIGYLRELTFRSVGEGTGHDLDLDRFDEYYIHLFLWNKQTREVVGGYRVGPTDKILKKIGLTGLYTHTLFDYGRRFIERIDPALEMGRSFVRPEYQRTYQALMLLWRGIGQIVAAKPRYKILFGPVSITQDYDPVSRHLIAAFFEENSRRSDLARLVKPRSPLRRPGRAKRELTAPVSFLQDLQALSEFVSDIENDRKGVPILLKQYVKLGGQSLGFNVDRDFNNALDSLILVDLTKTDRRILERYMGKEGAARFFAHHQSPPYPPAMKPEAGPDSSDFRP